MRRDKWPGKAPAAIPKNREANRQGEKADELEDGMSGAV
jgi:hypothetical protein